MRNRRTGRMIAAFLVLLSCLCMTGCGSTRKAELRALQAELAGLDGDPVPVYTGTGPKIPKVKNGDVYVTLENRSCDFYPCSPVFGEGFQILSETPLDPDRIGVEIPMQTKYRFTVYESLGHEELMTEAEAGDFRAVEAWLCREGTDWQAFGQAVKNASEAERRLLAGDSPETAERDRKITEDCEKLRQGYTDAAAQAAAMNDLFPEFYIYSVSLEFYDMQDETVESLELAIEGKTQTVVFGQWRFHARIPDNAGVYQAEGVMNRRAEAHAFDGSPYDGGLAVTCPAFELTTEKAIVLQRMWTDIEPTQLLGAEIDCADAGEPGGREPVHIQWDCASALEMSAGQKIMIDAVLYDAGFEQFNTRRTGWLYLEYTCGGEHCLLSLPYDLQGVTNDPWILAVQAFEDYDMGPYFTSYYPQEHASVQFAAGWLDHCVS